MTPDLLRRAAVPAAVVAACCAAAAAADFEIYRDVLVAGDVARMAALLKADAPRLPVDPDGVTVLHKALHVYSERRVRMVELLLAAGADVRARDREGNVPLHRNWQPALLAPGVDVRNAAGMTRSTTRRWPAARAPYDRSLRRVPTPRRRRPPRPTGARPSCRRPLVPASPSPRARGRSTSRAQWERTRGSTGRHEAALKVLEAAPPRRGWLSR